MAMASTTKVTTPSVTTATSQPVSDSERAYRARRKGIMSARVTPCRTAEATNQPTMTRISAALTTRIMSFHMVTPPSQRRKGPGPGFATWWRSGR